MIKTIVSTELPIDEKFRIRKNVISGTKKGPRLCVVTGTHGDELEGQMVCYELVKTVSENLKFLEGTLEVYPAFNPLGIDTIQRGIPNFDLDMNRIFPGDPLGTMAEQTAYALIEDIKGADMVIDIHSSNLYLRETPQVRINEKTAEKLVPFAEHLGMDFIWVHDAATVLEATLAWSLNVAETPCLVVEMGVGQRINNSMCRRLVNGIFNLMKHLGMWTGKVASPETKPVICHGGSVTFLNAETSGVFLTDLKCGTRVSKTETIGMIVDPLQGKMLSRVTSPVSGYMFTIRAYPIVYEGSLMARIFNS